MANLTPTTLEEFARQRYNAVGDTAFTSSEMNRYIWDAQMQLARETWCIRDVLTTTTVASQQEYAFPTATLAVKYLTVDSQTVEPRSIEEVLRLTASSAAPTGTPYIYAIWNEVFYLAPIPASAVTMKVYAVCEPAEVTTASTLEVPSRYHLDMAEYLLEQMCTKDKNYQGAAIHSAKWLQKVKEAKATERKLLRGQKFSFVKDESSSLELFGVMR